MSPDPDLVPNLAPPRGGRRAVPTVLQMETTECAAACLGMILAHHGRWVSIEELRIATGTSRDGANAASMLQAGQEYGLIGRGFRCSREHLFEIPFPMVLFWESNHFVVLEGIRGRRFYINDPGHGPRRLTLEEFDESYTGICLGFQKGAGFRRGGSKPSILRSLRRRFGHVQDALAFAALAALALLVPGLAVPTMLRVFVDDVLGRNGDWINALLAGLVMAALFRGGAIWLQRAFLARVEARLSIVMTSAFFWRLVTLPMPFFSQRYAGDLVSRAASNDRVARLLSDELAVNATNMLAMGFYAAVMLTYDVPLTLVAIAIAAANLLVLRLASRAREDANRRLLKEQDKLAGASVDGIGMIETLKANGAEDAFFARWSGLHANALDARQRVAFVSILANVFPPLLLVLGVVAVLGLGGLRVLDGELTIGSLVAFQSLAQSFTAPVSGLVQLGARLQVVRGDLARLDDVLQYAADERSRRAVEAGTPEEEQAPVPRGAVELRRVTYGHNVKEEPLIEDLTLSIRPGRRVALVGASGSGKSTVARLLCGLLTPWSGSVRIDGRDIERISPALFAEMVAHVDQEFVLFEGSVRDNVALWEPTVSERDVVQALRDAAIHDVVSERPGKYDAAVEEGGRNFSGGQRQRLEIARALARNPAVLVLDEATAALDPVTELEIDDRLRRRGCTCLIVAHRLSTIRDADEIIVLDGGRIVQRGTHEALMADEGLYRGLVGAG